MSRIVRFHKTGGPEVLQLEEVEVPAPAPNEMRIKVKALGLNRAEVLYRKGEYLVEPTFPSRLGHEASGTIEALGSEVKDFKLGDAVSIVPGFNQAKYGVYGEMALVPAKFVVKNPPNVSFEEAAAIWMEYMTAYGALIDIAAIKKDDFVVITAASSSVGLAAIQLCNLEGAIPIAATRTHEKKERLQKAGARHVIATKEEKLSTRLKEITEKKGVRIVFDPIGGKIVLDLAEGMAKGGILFQYGLLSNEETPFPLMAALNKGLCMRGYNLFEIVSDPVRFEKAKKYILEAISSKNLKPIIDKTFPLEKIREAHQHMESNQQFGKIVVTV